MTSPLHNTPQAAVSTHTSQSRQQPAALTPSPTSAEVTADIASVNSGIAVVEDAITREYTAAQPDKYGRVPADMPESLRALYESGSWCNSHVYLYDLVALVSREGHERAHAAEQALARVSFRPPPGLAQVPSTTLRAEQSPAVIAAAAAASSVHSRIRAVIVDRRIKKAAHVRGLAVQYRSLRKGWLASLDAADKALTPAQREVRVSGERALFQATRAPAALTNKEIDSSLLEIRTAGGTSGGLSRWSSSLATIPDQDQSYTPPDGGVFLDDPLAAHYAARSVNPWTRAERLLFLEKFIIHNKSFRRIATFFEHKSVEDVIRFYFDNKLALKLKQLTKDAQVKKRNTKKNALIELSRMPIEHRSMWNNFAGYAGEPSSDDDKPDPDDNGFFHIPSEFSVEESSLMHEAGKGWSSKDQQALIFALCRHRVDDDFKWPEIPIVWCRISGEVGTKTPTQCRRFYAQFNSLLGLEQYQPPDTFVTTAPEEMPAARIAADVARKSAPKRPRSTTASTNSVVDRSVAEPVSSKPRCGASPSSRGDTPSAMTGDGFGSPSKDRCHGHGNVVQGKFVQSPEDNEATVVKRVPESPHVTYTSRGVHSSVTGSGIQAPVASSAGPLEKSLVKDASPQTTEGVIVRDAARVGTNGVLAIDALPVANSTSVAALSSSKTHIVAPLHSSASVPVRSPIVPSSNGAATAAEKVAAAVVGSVRTPASASASTVN
jgi:hypothetical protein